MGLALVRERGDGFEKAEGQFGAMVEFLESLEASGMTESDLERRLSEEGRELLRNLLAAHVRMQ